MTPSRALKVKRTLLRATRSQTCAFSFGFLTGLESMSGFTLTKQKWEWILSKKVKRRETASSASGDFPGCQYLAARPHTWDHHGHDGLVHHTHIPQPLHTNKPMFTPCSAAACPGTRRCHGGAGTWLCTCVQAPWVRTSGLTIWVPPWSTWEKAMPALLLN